MQCLQMALLQLRKADITPSHFPRSVYLWCHDRKNEFITSKDNSVFTYEICAETRVTTRTKQSLKWYHLTTSKYTVIKQELAYSATSSGDMFQTGV